MKNIIIFLLAYSFSICYAEIRFVNKKIQIAIATVDGIEVYTKTDKDELVDKKTKVKIGTITSHIPVVADLAPTEYEINISTILFPSSHSEYQRCLTREGLWDKLLKLKSEIELAIELNDIAKEKNLKENYGWLKKHYEEAQ